jgi:rRNA maturation RNase YbeY
MVKPLVKFGYADASWSSGKKSMVKQWVLELVALEKGIPVRLQYVFCSDAYLHDINVSFLQHDDYTDIITFDLSEDSAKCIIGEIYISVERVRANALIFKVNFFTEMCRVIFHGALHLCGYRDKTTQEAAIMRMKEDFYLKKFGVL